MPDISPSDKGRLESTLQEDRIRNENAFFNLRRTLAEQLGKHDKDLENKLHSLRMDDVFELNNEKTKIDRKYRDLVIRGILTQQQAEIKAYKEFDIQRRIIDARRRSEEKRFEFDKRVEAHKAEVEASKSRLALYLNEQEQIKKIDKEKRMEDYSSYTKMLEELQKKRRAAIAKGEDTTALNNLIKNYKEKIKDTQEEISEANKPTARVGFLRETVDVAKQLGNGTVGAIAELKDFLKGDVSKDALKERAESGDKIAEATLKNIDKLEERMNSFINGIKELLTSYIQEYSSYQGKVNARLQGSNSNWNSINTRLTNSVGATPYVKLSKLMENVSTAVEAGIAYNVEQRAFLQSIKEDIATTFDAFNANLLRIVRLQQNDSTSARLGLEADLTQLFNTYFSDTSYLSDAFDNVSSSLTEAIAQMTTKEGLAFEYQVQKWLGSLYSVGFSESTISNIASALGMLGSGDVSGLANNSAMQNLIVMAASRVGLSYAEMLTEGLDSDTTNKLLASMVEYLQEIATSDNKIIKSQYSQIFGLTTSDLVAAENLGTTISNLAQVSLNYSDAVNELYNQMNQLPTRLSVGEMTGNLIDNVKYTLAQGIAGNPFTYALWEITDMIEGLSGGLHLPTISVLGNSFDLNTSLTNLARLGIAGAGLFSNIGSIINGVSNSFNPAGILTSLGVSTSANNTITRGRGLGRKQALSNQVSSSVMIGNSASEDYEASLTAQANAKGEEALNIKKQEEQTKSINDIHEYLLQVFDPKLTGITKMLGVLSGSDVSNGKTWGDFTTSSDEVYHASTVKIENIGENNMANKNFELMKTIDTNVSAIVELLKGTLTVSVLNYGLITGDVPDSKTRHTEGNW